jgi:hypothetical protein
MQSPIVPWCVQLPSASDRTKASQNRVTESLDSLKLPGHTYILAHRVLSCQHSY